MKSRNGQGRDRGPVRENVRSHDWVRTPLGSFPENECDYAGTAASQRSHNRRLGPGVNGSSQSQRAKDQDHRGGEQRDAHEVHPADSPEPRDPLPGISTLKLQPKPHENQGEEADWKVDAETPSPVCLGEHASEERPNGGPQCVHSGLDRHVMTPLPEGYNVA